MVGVLDLGIDLDVWPWVWLGVAVIFALVELTILAGSFVLLPFAVSAFGASLAGFYGANVETQWGIFLFGGGVLWFLFWRFFKRFVNDNAMPEGVGADRLAGTTAIVTVPIDPDDTNRRGRVKVMGEEWGALTEASTPLTAGSKVRITGMYGTRVVVEPITFAPPTEPPTAPPTSPPSGQPTPSDPPTTPEVS